jgi:outer membrane phospholipase A
MKIIFAFILLLSLQANAEELSPGVVSIFKSNQDEKFTFHQPTYFIFGKDDLKLQFSFKYRAMKTLPLYFAYSQLMFWDIYKDSKPFRDSNYRPEVFYRTLESENSFLTSLDFGYMHLSNGRDKESSRSLERVFVRTNLLAKIEGRHLGVILQVHKIFDEQQNEQIEDHLGYWEAVFYMTKLFTIDKQHTDLEIRTYAGSKVVDISNGAVQVGLVHHFNSEDFNPALYLQYFEGYAENLIGYDKKRSEIRLGLMLSF